MKIHHLHVWNISPAEAVKLQNELRKRLVLKNRLTEMRTVAGCDMAIDTKNELCIAGAVVLSFPDLEILETQYAVKPLNFPYIPGLLSFREAPALLAALEKVKTEPSMILFDGQGIAHPRGMGIASHMGLFLDRPSVGCGKSRLYGRFKEPALKAGSCSPLTDERGNLLGYVLRTRDKVKPVFVSPGHYTDAETAVSVVKQCCDGLRLPKPVREADHYVGRMKREAVRAA